MGFTEAGAVSLQYFHLYLPNYLSIQVYVEAENVHGVGDPTNRIVFRTAKEQRAPAEESDLAAVAAEHTQCCFSAEVKPECKQRNH